MDDKVKQGRHSASALELQRKQLDARFSNLAPVQTPRGGWIRTIRQALGMTMRQFGKRLRISPQSVVDLEERERKETISVARLRAAADALNCDLSIAFLPRTSLQETIGRQAAMKARDDRNRLVHTMRLEAQDVGVEEALDESKATVRWLTTRARRLWD